MSNKKCENSAGVLKKTDLLFGIFFTLIKDPCPAFLTYHLMKMNYIVSPRVLCSLEIYVRGDTKVLPHFFQTQ